MVGMELKVQKELENRVAELKKSYRPPLLYPPFLRSPPFPFLLLFLYPHPTTSTDTDAEARRSIRSTLTLGADFNSVTARGREGDELMS